MIVYVIIQTWQTPYESTGTEVLKVFNSKDKVEKFMKDIHKEDVDWICDVCGIEESDIEANDITEIYSYVHYDETYSETYTKEVEVE